MPHNIPVEDHPELVRDPHSKAIINKDKGAFNKRVMEREKVIAEVSKSNLLTKLNAKSREHDKTINGINDKIDKILALLTIE